MMHCPAPLATSPPLVSSGGHKGSPLHTAFVGTVLTSFTRLPQQTVFWNQNFGTPQQEVKGGWLLLVCHFPDALQTLDNINYG